MNDFDPTKHGIFQRFLTADGTLRTQIWNLAVEGKQHVATCRWCGFPMLGRPTHQAGQITWYGAYCTNPACGREFAAPNAGYLARSGRHDEMPRGYWENRKGD